MAGTPERNDSQLNSEKDLLAGLAKEYIEETLKCFRLSEDEEKQAMTAVELELERWFPRFVECLTVAALLPVIQQRAEAHFRKKGMPPVDAEILAGVLCDKLFQSLFGGWPRVNPGAMVRTYRANLHMDYRRSEKRKEKRVGKRESDVVLKNLSAHEIDESAIRRAIEALPPEAKSIVARLWQGEDWPEIAASLGKSVKDLQAEVRKAIQRVGE